MVVKRKGSTEITNIRNKLGTNSNTNHNKYWTPLTSQVEEIVNTTQQITRIEKDKR